MASITVKVPQGYPTGGTLSVYVDRVGDIIPQGPPVSTAVIASDGSVTLTGLTQGIPYQAGMILNGTWRSFLVELPVTVPSTFDQVVSELTAHEAATTTVHGIAATAALATGTDVTNEATARAAGDTSVGSPNVQTGSYTLALSDAGKAVDMNAAGATVVTVPPNSSVAFPIGTVIEIARYGAGTVTLAAGAGVTIRSNGNKLAIGNQYSAVTLRKRATDEWWLNGDLT